MVGSKEDIISYIEDLFGNDAKGYLVIFESSKAKVRRTRVVPYSDRAPAVELLANQPPDVHHYLAFALHDEEAYEKSNRWQHTAVVVSGLALDVDLATGIHAVANLAADPGC